MPYGLYVVNVANTDVSIEAWVMEMDVDANEGRGGTTFTRMPHHAKQWPSMQAAFLAYRQQSKVKPLRDDGKPNRPMLAFTIEIRRID